MKYTDKRTWTVRIVAIAMAVLLLLSIVSLLFNSLAVDEMMEIAATGSQDTPKWPIFAAVGALAVIAACVIIPKLNKKD